MRIPQEVLNRGNKFEMAAARQGLFSCPHLGIMCRQSTAREVLNCPGYSSCNVREFNQFIERLWVLKEGEA